MSSTARPRFLEAVAFASRVGLTQWHTPDRYAVALVPIPANRPKDCSWRYPAPFAFAGDLPIRLPFAQSLATTLWGGPAATLSFHSGFLHSMHASFVLCSLPSDPPLGDALSVPAFFSPGYPGAYK